MDVKRQRVSLKSQPLRRLRGKKKKNSENKKNNVLNDAFIFIIEYAEEPVVIPI